jgi:polyhydroxyalkanoate synthesis regulator phasin
MTREEKYVVVKGDQRLTEGMSKEEAQKFADELRQQLQESQQPYDDVAIKLLLLD